MYESHEVTTVNFDLRRNNHRFLSELLDSLEQDEQEVITRIQRRVPGHPLPQPMAHHPERLYSYD